MRNEEWAKVNSQWSSAIIDDCVPKEIKIQNVWYSVGHCIYSSLMIMHNRQSFVFLICLWWCWKKITKSKNSSQKFYSQVIERQTFMCRIFFLQVKVCYVWQFFQLWPDLWFIIILKVIYLTALLGLKKNSVNFL